MILGWKYMQSKWLEVHEIDKNGSFPFNLSTLANLPPQRTKVITFWRVNVFTKLAIYYKTKITAIDVQSLGYGYG